MNEPTRTAWEFILEETAEANRSNTRLRNRLTGPERLCGRGRSNPVSRNRQFLASNVSHSLLPAGRDCACRGAGDRRRVHRHTTTMHAHNIPAGEAESENRSCGVLARIFIDGLEHPPSKGGRGTSPPLPGRGDQPPSSWLAPERSVHRRPGWSE